MIAAGATAGGLLSASLVKGWGRLTAIENAQAKIKGLGNDAKSTSTIMDNALASVKGTSFGLGEAATTAAGAVAAGIKPGKDLEGVLKSVANSAAASGIGMDEMGGIYNRVASNGKASNAELQQVADRGIPIYKALGDQLGLTSSEVFDLASKGKINFAQFNDAMTSASGNVAQEMGKTATGSIANFGAALGRLGAGILGGVFPKIAPIVQKLTEKIDVLTEAAAPLGEALGAGLSTAVEKIPGILSGIGDGVRTVFDAFAPAVSQVVDAFRPLGPQLVEIWQGFSPLSLAMSALKPLLPLLADAFAAIGTSVADLVPPLAEMARAVTDALLPVVGQLVATVLPAAVKLFTALVPVLSGAAQGVAKFVQWLSPALPTLAKLALAIGGVVLAVKGYNAVLKLGKAVQLGWTAATYGAAGASYASGKAAKAAAAIHGGYLAVLKTGKALMAGWRAAQVLSWKSTMAMTGATKAQTIAMKAGAIAQRLFNAVMNMNPIAKVVVALTALVGGVIYAYKHFKWFRDLVNTVWDGIKAATKVVVDWFMTYVWPSLQTGLKALGAVFQWLYENIVKPVWTAIKTAIAIVVTAVLLVLKGLKLFVEKVLAPAFTWFYQYVIKPVWDAVSAAIRWAWTNVIKPVFEAIKWAWKLVGEAFKLYWTYYMKPILTALWNLVKWVWTNVLRPTFNAIKAGFKAVGTGIQWTWKNVLKPVFETVGSFFRSVWKNVLKPAFGAVKKGFRAIGDSVKWVWTNILKPPLQAVGDFVNDTVVPAFEDGVGLIKSAWEGLKDIFKAPITFFAETVYNKGVVPTWNFVAKPFGLKTLETWKRPKGWDTGGYTGPGGKYVPAGIVHRDEYVIRKESTRKLRKHIGLGGLDYINRTGMLPSGGYAKGGFVRPVKGGHVWGNYGTMRPGGKHTGEDIALPAGSPIVAALAGKVKSAGWNAVPGRTGIGVLLGHAGNQNTYYGHMSRKVVSKGDKVSAGELIGAVGSTGNSTGPHLHFEFWNGNSSWKSPVNPNALLAGGSVPNAATGAAGAAMAASMSGMAGDIVGGGVTDFVGDLIDSTVGKFKAIYSKIKDGLSGGAEWIGGVATGAKNVVKGGIEWAKGLAFKPLANVSDALGITKYGGKKEAPGPASGGVKQVVKDAAAMRGWDTGANWSAISNIVQRESGWRTDAKNPDSTASGLGQLTKANRKRGLGTPGAQALDMMDYIHSRYGTPVKAWSFWQKKHSYSDGGLVKPTLFDKGGALMPGTQLVSNKTKRPEYILPAHVTDALVGGSGSPSMLAGEIHINAFDADEAFRKLERERRKREALYV
ncbi:MAG: peptidoglycan DD-metalloendopeptidase family protein [Galactobacter sp.]